MLRALKLAADTYHGNVDWQSAIDAARMGAGSVADNLEGQLGLVGGDPVHCETCDVVMAETVSTVLTLGGSLLARGAWRLSVNSVTERIVIGAMDDITAPGAIHAGERTLWAELTPDLGGVARNWARNERVLLSHMDRRLPIRDASVVRVEDCCMRMT